MKHIYKILWSIIFLAILVGFATNTPKVRAHGYDEVEFLDNGQIDMPDDFRNRYFFRLHDKASGIELICITGSGDSNSCVATGRKW